MNGRYEKIVLEAKNGIAFNVREGEQGELIIKAFNMAPLITYSENYVNPPIPTGYKYVEGKWNNGFVIERESDKSQFVWVPVGSLRNDGTLDGDAFIEKFGRRNFRKEDFTKNVYHEELSKEFLEQLESVKKYGGFYISRFNISMGKDGKPQSVIDQLPWVNIKFFDALRVAESMEKSEQVTSHLTFGAEYDSVLAWFINSGARTVWEIVEDSSQWGNYWNTNNTVQDKTKTGACQDWCANNIYDFAGNINEWTQERKDADFYVVRGGSFAFNGNYTPVSIREYHLKEYSYFITGFRVVLCIK